MPLVFIGRVVIATLIVVTCVFFGPATAQVPELTRLLSGSAPAAVAASAPEVSAANWAARLQDLQQSYTQWQQLADPSAGELLRLMERVLEQLRSFVQSEQAGSTPEDTLADQPTPPTEGEAAPFSTLDVDAVRDLRDHAAAQQRMLANTLALLEDEVVAALAQRKKAGEAVRLRQEQMESAPSEADKPALRVELELARVHRLSAELQVAQAVRTRARARARHDAWRQPLQRLDQEIDRVRTHQHISEQDMAQIRQQSQAAVNRWESRRLKAAQMLARLESGTAQEAYPMQAQALQTRVRALLELRALAHGQVQVWQYRQRALQASADPRLAREAAQAIEPALAQVGQRLLAVEDRRDLLVAQQRAYAARQSDGLGAAPASADAKTLADVRELADLYEHMRQELVRTRVQLTRSLDDLNLSSRQHGLRYQWSGLQQALQKIWQFELFSATETSLVNGQTVSVDYGVTVGKSIGVLVLFVLGYLLATRLARALTRLLVHRGGVSEALARVLQRWVMSLLVLLVLLVVLRMARVPLTVFAFLGGALAIGFGFGAQNIIKNLISGVIILFERKVRVGDVITIGGISGTVTAVDLRATTVSGFDGVISIVPNSFLLEQQVSSWSYGNPALRRSITVGVAYGSDTAVVQQQLLSCAQAHPLLLTAPAPVVMLEDFAADNLLFRLNYWIAQDCPRSGPEMDSDLRLAMETALKQAGVRIPFVQRDIHLHAAGPLAVRCESQPP